MRALMCYQTADGEIFSTEHKAAHHAEERYGALAVALARELCLVEKYTDALAWLEVNEERLAELARRSADRVLHRSEDADG